ncbi:hypothetical protein AQJ30_17345 [Streptomyces longwoodensis]|uniref:Lipoprotein n=2 Tax=Streptomyces longwoodensis TaxID=68231 RepID=A0A117QN50_9ACTN|nr:hypothetical protein AQJ30_17345 [Streptomyces longwoodensis]
MAGAVTGCAGGGTSEPPPAADQMLDEANATMRGLRSVTIDSVTRSTTGGDLSSRLTTDLKGTCAFELTSDTGARLDQIRIDGTDYVRPNRTYVEEWSRSVAGTGEQGFWARTPVSASREGDGLSQCTHPFASFGKVKKGRPTEIDGVAAMSLEVTDATSGAYTFYVATEGRPYLLKVVYKDAEMDTTTSFSAFDEPLDVHPPDQAKVLDLGGTG